jgi:hypothetical protein
MAPDDRDPAPATVQPERLDAVSAGTSGREAALRGDPIVVEKIKAFIQGTADAIRPK